MKKFDNFSAIEDLSMDSGFFNITSGVSNVSAQLANTTARASFINNILGVYNQVKNLTATIEGVTGYSIASKEPEYDSYFNSTKLNEASTTTLQSMSNAFGEIKGKLDGGIYLQNAGQSANMYAIQDFRNLAKQYYPNLKKTWSFYGMKAKHDILNTLPQEYQDVFKDPFFSENFSQQDMVDIHGELVGVGLRDDLSLNEKKNLFMDIIKIYVPTLPTPSSSSSSMGSIDLSTTEEERAEGATTDSKINIAKYAIIGGVLVVGGVATWLILRKK
jgi:hypothetical protein